MMVKVTCKTCINEFYIDEEKAIDSEPICKECMELLLYPIYEDI